MEHTPAPITPPIVPASSMRAAKAIAKRRKKRTLYTPALARAICKMLSRGHTLTSICKRPLMPREDVVLGWAINPAHPFSDHYARAREVGYIRMADQLVDIADHSINDYATRLTKDGGVESVPNKELLERTRLRIDTRKWLLAKALPKIYGDKLQAEHSGKVEQVHSEAPQPTGEDHLADITRRYAVKANSHTNGKANGAAKPNGKANGLH